MIKFKIRKVLIQRPWLQEEILNYPTLGIDGVPKNLWSTGDLSANKNNGIFPILPTALVVAKDVEISADSYSGTAESSFKQLTTEASVKVRELLVASLGSACQSIFASY